MLGRSLFSLLGMAALGAGLGRNVTSHKPARRARPDTTGDYEPRGFAGAKLLRKARKGQLGIARLR